MSVQEDWARVEVAKVWADAAKLVAFFMAIGIAFAGRGCS